MSIIRSFLKYTELIPNVDRPLTEKELDGQLHQRQRVKIEPHDVSSVIRLNSTYLEVVDIYYGWKGVLVLGGTTITPLLAFGLFKLLHYFITLPPYINIRAGVALTIPFAVLFCLSVICVGFAFFFYEAFRYTHFPIRFNRNNRLVYVFRRNGTVLAVPWEEVFFRLREPRAEGRDYIIEGYVLDKDRVTVREIFKLGYTSSETYNMYLHWEYIRRYMEMGPVEVFDRTEVCLPIWDRRESPTFGFWRLLYNVHKNTIFQLLFSWFFLLCAIGRVIAVWTSRIPKWPREVEDACAVDPNDPYARDWRMNTRPYLLFFNRKPSKL